MMAAKGDRARYICLPTMPKRRPRFTSSFLYQALRRRARAARVSRAPKRALRFGPRRAARGTPPEQKRAGERDQEHGRELQQRRRVFPDERIEHTRGLEKRAGDAGDGCLIRRQPQTAPQPSRQTHSGSPRCAAADMNAPRTSRRTRGICAAGPRPPACRARGRREGCRGATWCPEPRPAALERGQRDGSHARSSAVAKTRASANKAPRLFPVAGSISVTGRRRGGRSSSRRSWCATAAHPAHAVDASS